MLISVEQNRYWDRFLSGSEGQKRQIALSMIFLIRTHSCGGSADSSNFLKLLIRCSLETYCIDFNKVRCRLRYSFFCASELWWKKEKWVADPDPDVVKFEVHQAGPGLKSSSYKVWFLFNFAIVQVFIKKSKSLCWTDLFCFTLRGSLSIIFPFISYPDLDPLS